MKISSHRSRLVILSLLFGQLTLSACRHSSDSDPKVTGGREDYDILPTSVGIDPDGNQQVSCTGGFVSDRLLLTAAHCIKDISYRSPPSVSIVSNAQAFKGLSIRGYQLSRHPDYDANLSPELLSADLGFVLFPPGTAPKEMIIPIAQIASNIGDDVQLVGWGRVRKLNGGEEIIGKRHYGRNKIMKIDSQLNDAIKFQGVALDNDSPENFNRATPYVGDSGGPLYNSKNELIGICSNSVEQKNQNLIEASYANVLHPANRKYIEETIAAFASAPETRKAEQEKFLPVCRSGAIREGGALLRIEKRNEQYGFMSVSMGNGFICQVDPGKSNSKELPSCAAACGDVTQTEEVFGFCPKKPGYDCKIKAAMP